MSLFFERLVHKKQITEKQMNWLSMLNISSLLIIPASIIRSTNTNPCTCCRVLYLARPCTDRAQPRVSSCSC